MLAVMVFQYNSCFGETDKTHGDTDNVAKFQYNSCFGETWIEEAHSLTKEQISIQLLFWWNKTKNEVEKLRNRFQYNSCFGETGLKRHTL